MRSSLIILLFFPVLIYSESYIDSLKQNFNITSGEIQLGTLQNIIDYYSVISIDSFYNYSLKGFKLAEATGDSANQEYFRINLAYYYYNVGDKDKALNFYNEALSYFTRVNDSLKISYCYLMLCNFYFDNCEIDSARNYLNRSIYLYQKLNYLNGVIQCYVLKCSLESFVSNYSEAMEANLKGFEICQQEVKISDMFILLYVGGHIFYDIKNYLRSIEYYHKASRSILSQERNFELGLCFLSIGKSFYAISNLDSAKIYSQKGYEFFKKTNFAIHYPYFLTTLGDIELSFGKSNKALDYYKSSLFYAKKFNNSWYESYTLQRLAHYYFKETNYYLAIKLCLNSNFLARKIKSKDISLDNFLLLSRCYEKTGNVVLAIENLNKYISLKDSIFFMNQHNITDLQVAYHTENVRKEKEILQKDNAILKLEAEKQRLLKTRFFLGFALVSVLTILILYLYRHKQRHNKILQKRIHEALRKQRDQQEIITHQAGLTALGELTAGIAHEMNQPLQNISMNAECIGQVNKEHQIFNQEISRNVREINGYVERIRSIIEHIRLFTSRQQEEYSQQFSINESIWNAHQMVGKQFSIMGITVRLELEENLPSTSGNPYQFEQVVLNLLLNARDAVEEKGKQVNGDYQKLIGVKSKIINSELILEIKDNGLGISESDRLRIFEPFYSTKKLGQGQGLGLSIAHRIISSMSGRIELKSELLMGTTFRVVVPTVAMKRNGNEIEINAQLKGSYSNVR